MNEAEQEREKLLKDAKEKLEIGDKDLEDQFGNSSLGLHEAVDRSYMVQCMWDDFVVNHPSVLMNSKLFALAHEINEMLAEFYCAVATESEKETE